MARLPQLFIPSPTEAELRSALRRAFVEQYIYDFDETLALVRLGYSIRDAGLLGYRLLQESETQQLMVKAIDRRTMDEIASKQAVVAGLLREAHNRTGSARPSDRIAAWRALGRILGMEAREAREKAGSGVMVVPATPSVDSWERESRKAQRKLKKEVSKL